ncbi:MAG: hypothetical protein ABL309_13855 [Phycisphaerales bacterium]
MANEQSKKGQGDQNVQAETRIAELEGELKVMTEAASDARKEADQAKAHAEGLAQSLNNVERQKAALEGRLETDETGWRAEVERREKTIAEQAEVIASLKTKNAKLDGKVTEIVRAVTSAGELQSELKAHTASKEPRKQPAFSRGGMRAGYTPRPSPPAETSQAAAAAG